MVGLCGLSRRDWVLEIGAGLGALTKKLGSLVAKVIAVEKDKRLCAALSEILSGFDNVKIECGDFLKLDLKQISEDAPNKLKVIGNLPYYITTPVLEKLIINKDRFNDIFVTVQKEVAQRLCAKASSKDYGSISCYVQFHMRPNILFHISRRAFHPQPEVDSVFLKLDILSNPPVQVNDRERLFEIIRAAFNKRRKTILNSLLSCKSLRLDKAQLNVLLTRAGIRTNARAEELSLADFARICESPVD